MGNWRSRHKQHEDGTWQQQALQPSEELLKFLSTAPGATWLADVLLGKCSHCIPLAGVHACKHVCMYSSC
jgi:hypothetical protein